MNHRGPRSGRHPQLGDRGIVSQQHEQRNTVCITRLALDEGPTTRAKRLGPRQPREQLELASAFSVCQSRPSVFCHILSPTIASNRRAGALPRGQPGSHLVPEVPEGERDAHPHARPVATPSQLRAWGAAGGRAPPHNRVADLHVWRVGPRQLAAILSVVSHAPRPPEHYRDLLRGHDDLMHRTVEVHGCDGEPCVAPPA